MSHFSVCVIVPDDGVVNNIHANNLEDHLIPVLAPFDEQTEEEKWKCQEMCSREIPKI